MLELLASKIWGISLIIEVIPSKHIFSNVKWNISQKLIVFSHSIWTWISKKIVFFFSKLNLVYKWSFILIPVHILKATDEMQKFSKWSHSKSGFYQDVSYTYEIFKEKKTRFSNVDWGKKKWWFMNRWSSFN